REYLSTLHRGRAQGPARTGAGARLPRSTGRPARPAVRRPGGRELARRVGLAEVGLVTRLTRLRLCIMMFLEFFIWGGWFVTLGSYLAANLHASGAQTALAYSTQSWGAIIAPFIVGLVAGLGVSYLFAWDSHAAMARGALRNTFLMCSIASFALGLYSFTLPRTPPLPQRRDGSRLRQFLGVDALVLLRESNFLVFFLAS